MNLDTWASAYDGVNGIACELLGCHDAMYVLCLPNVPGYVILNATTGAGRYATWRGLILDFGADCEVKPLTFREAVRA